MVKITKPMMPKHKDSYAPFIEQYVNEAAAVPLQQLPKKLDDFPSRWPFPRGDLYHWVPLLNRFDSTLERFCNVYKLQEGPQTRNFTCELLEEDKPEGTSHIEAGFSDEGDRELIEAILKFSRLLLESCGNRSIYASSPYLTALFNSTSLSLLSATLSIGVCLAQRYQASYKRMMPQSRHASSALLDNHYNIDLSRVLQMSLPFARTSTVSEPAIPATPVTPATPIAKSKDKAYFNIPAATGGKTSTSTHYANDLVSLARGDAAGVDSPLDTNSRVDWNDWAEVRLTYYENKTTEDIVTKALQPATSAASQTPSTPTPVRRSSTLSQQNTSRSARASGSEEPNSPLNRMNTFPADESQSSSPLKALFISNSQIKSTSIHQLLEDNLPKIPKDSHYELLSKLRIAFAFSSSSAEVRRQILAVRILAITNLCYIHTEQQLIEKSLKQDADEPRRLQLVYQLAELVHPPAKGQSEIPRSLQTIAIYGLEGLAQYPEKLPDISLALNVSVNHGVLMYVVRKFVAELAIEEFSGSEKRTEDDIWRSAVFNLLSHVAMTPHDGVRLFGAGLMPILIEVLNFRTMAAERYHSKFLHFFDSTMIAIKESFPAFVAADGIESMCNLLDYEVQTASDLVAAGKGPLPSHRAPNVDYAIPHYKQSAMSRMFRLVHHAISSVAGGGNGFDRLLRILIDSSKFLKGMRIVMENAKIFGSAVWTNSVIILNDFINNEPTSFSIINEAGLTRAFLEAVSGKEIKMPDADKHTSDVQVGAHSDVISQDSDEHSIVSIAVDDTPHPPTAEMLDAPRDVPLARGIIPSMDAMNAIPQTFGAICLNSAGMRMFQASDALKTFFEIFESPEHVRLMESDHNLPAHLGWTFDELVRHHPPLKDAVLNASIDMVARVAHLCKSKTFCERDGAHLFLTDSAGRVIPARQAAAVDLPDNSKGKARADADVEMGGMSSDGAASESADVPSEPKATSAFYINAVSLYLTTFICNTGLRSGFLEKGGIEMVLDLAESPSLPATFVEEHSGDGLQKVIAQLAEQKPHLLLPSLIKRTQAAADALRPLTEQAKSHSYFMHYLSDSDVGNANTTLIDRDAGVLRAMVNFQSLANSLRQCFAPPMYNHRTSTTPFNQLNLGDYWIRLVNSMGSILGASVAEDFNVQRSVPYKIRRACRPRDHYGFSNESATVLDSFDLHNPDSQAAEMLGTMQSTPLSQAEKETAQYKNYNILRTLFSKVAPTIAPFFQVLGKSLLTKRTLDGYGRQTHGAIADALTSTILQNLLPMGEEPTVANFHYWTVMLETIKELLVNVSRHTERPYECITLVLQSFRKRDGLHETNRILQIFTDECRKPDSKAPVDIAKVDLARGGAKIILNLYLLLVTGKNLADATQTSIMLARGERDPTKAEFFTTGQLLVEVRMAILPIIRQIWESDLAEKGTSQLSSKLIEIIRAIATADNEGGALKKTDKVATNVNTPTKRWKISTDGLTSLTAIPYPEDLVKEALFRCANNQALSKEYCNVHKDAENDHAGGRNPVPVDEVDVSSESAHRAPVERWTGASTPEAALMVLDDGASEVVTEVPAQEMGPPPVPGSLTDEPMTDSYNSLLNGINRRLVEASGPIASSSQGAASESRPTPPSPNQQSLVSEANDAAIVTIEDLNGERHALREHLIDRCLEVISAQSDVTFEISDLIITVVNKSPESNVMRKEIGETLVLSLMSFAAEDDIGSTGKKIAVSAHLLALMLQDKPFYNACLGELRNNLQSLLGFIQLSTAHGPDDPSPWISHVLLIFETLLCDDAQPQETKWTYPKTETDVIERPLIMLGDPVVPQAERSALLNAILDIMPRVGKADSLAFAVLRILVILSRDRSIAKLMGEKKNMQRLFVMAKQLAGVASVKLQNPLMIILRHIIEDDDTIKQIMRSDIRNFFEVVFRGRPTDVKSYISASSALIVRNPEFFVQVSNEMLKLTKWGPSTNENPMRQVICLKDEFRPNRRGADPSALILPAVQATEELSIDDIKPSTEEVPSEAVDKPKPTELKTPVVENPDGVIHFLLSELLSYRDVEDREPTTPVTEKATKEITSAPGTPSTPEVQNDSTNVAPDLTATNDDSTLPKPAKKSHKQEFKAEEHPIYIYRCFLLQCLTELLHSYNRTKIEFINFKRNSLAQTTTPSKPRSSVVNYLLTDLIPHGTLEHTDTIAHRKKLLTSSWADSVLVALLSKTGEQIFDRYTDPLELNDEPDLHFVRKFVLENILKAYKEAAQSTEPLDTKYARILSLADLMSHIMTGKDQHGGMGESGVQKASSYQLKRIMYEKGYVAALTTSIADIDLNFPQAKRAVKYILKPLKVLTQTAIDLSDEGKITTPPGEGDADEIASATSVSEIEDEREETPDLFRNSSLGMFEPGHEHESSEDSEDDEDEEMYEGEFDDEEMDYEEEMIDEDDEDNISDDDEELEGMEGMGPIEGMPGDHGMNVEVMLEDDGDEEDDSENDSEDDDDDEDDESDSLEGMEDDEHDHSHVEIVDEEGNVIHGHEDDEDWQSDDEEDEEDYEGRAADEEEAEEEMRLDMVGGGPMGDIGDLLRTVVAGDNENAAELFQHALEGQMQDGGMGFDFDPGRADLDEMGIDEEDDDEDDDEMDEEDGAMLDEYPRMPFGWDPEDVGQPIIINHRGHQRGPHRHGVPSTFPFFASSVGARDLGGMSNISHQDPLNEAILELSTTLRAVRGLSNELRHFRNIARSADVNGENQEFLQEAEEYLDRMTELNSGFETSRFAVSMGETDVSSGMGADFIRGPSYRSHRPSSNARGADDGINPLLQRNGNLGFGREGPRGALLGPTVQVLRPADALLDIGIGRAPFGESPNALLNQVFNSLLVPPGSISRSGHALTFQVTGGPPGASRQLEALFGPPRGSHYEGRRREQIQEPGNQGSFVPQSTTVRWMDEAKMLFGSTIEDKARKILTALMAVLVPEAIKATVESKRIEEEAKKKREEEERVVREKKEAEEKAAREKKEAEAAEERARQEAAAAAAAVERGEELEEDKPGENMEGIEAEEGNTSHAPSEEAEAPARERVLVQIGGREVDITELGIDPEFLAQIPEELQQEVVASAIQERRTQVTATGAQPSGIEQEFLDALPDEIREEIIQQERLDRRRREREEARRQASENNGGGGPMIVPQDMDAASILATLDPVTREQVLREQEDEVLALLPPEWAAQANAGRRQSDRALQGGRGGPGRYRGDRQEVDPTKRARPTIVQMLDKCGVATLLRLMFVYQQGTLRSTLFQVLQNVSENRHNRSEVISTLLHILQDGSADMTAIERSFAHLSLRAKQSKDSKDKEPKTPQPMKRTLTGGNGINVVSSSEVSPLLVVQQCLSALVYLSQVNAHIPSFFLSEHESSTTSLKRNASRKGKGKETKSAKYALNSLLGLLDRKLIMESATTMESLSDLLSKITAPLQALDRRQRESDAEEVRKKETAEKSTDHATGEDSTEGDSVAAEPNDSGTTGQSEAVQTDDAGKATKPDEADVKVTEAKKSRPFVPPVIPESNLKLVINIFVARECGNKTFRDTLSTVKNLAVVPGAREIFGRELIIKAQELAENILVDLDQLLPQIQKATTGTEIQGLALSNFSAAGSDQNKLLRVLKALDHIFDSRPAKALEVDLASPTATSTEKQDLLLSLYENPRFSPMWDKLSACLAAIRQRDHMQNVATILLPLIEALMVVCRNTTIKDTANTKLQPGSSMVLTSPPPESRMETLFFTFTEDHRKILNDLVRQNPKLMKGSFSLLVKNPKILEFDNKRSYFNTSMHDKDRNSRQSYPPLQFTVKRDQVFHDSYRSLGFKKGDELKYGKLSIRFSGEEGVDAGGVTREWFQVLTRQMFDPGYALFIPVSSDRTTFHPNHLSTINPEHLSFFKFIGRIIGKALYEGRVLDCHFSRAVYKSILGKSVSVKDMESLDPEYYKSVVWMLENDITDVITETFSVDDDEFGVVNTVDLIEDGRNIPVTEDNKQEYVRLMVEHKLTGAVKEQLREFLKGFHEIIPAELISIFNEQELELLISGLPEIDVDDWKNNTELHQYTASSPQIQWFWRAIRSFDKEERAKMLQFVTGTSKVPLNGFKELEGMNGFSRFNIHRDYGNKERLPTSHTCFNQLDLPEYESYETLRQQVLTAITAGSEYFGFA